jgi:hypothetical protein
MVSGDKYTVHVVVHHLEADAMAKLLRQQPANLFVIGLREIHDAVDDINTDQRPEWTTWLRDSLNEFTDIIKEPDGLPRTRECDLEIIWSAMNHLRSKHIVCQRQNSKCSGTITIFTRKRLDSSV